MLRALCKQKIRNTLVTLMPIILEIHALKSICRTQDKRNHEQTICESDLTLFR